MLLKKSLLGLCALALILSSALPGDFLATGQARAEEKGGDWKQVSVLYNTDVKGKIEPCG
jgi:hypothetical protein